MAKADDITVAPEIRTPGDAIDLMKKRAEAQKLDRRYREPSVKQAMNTHRIKQPAKAYKNRYFTDTGFSVGDGGEFEHPQKRRPTLWEGWDDGQYPGGVYIEGPTAWPSKELAEEAGLEFCDPDTWSWSGSKPRFSFYSKEVS